MLAVGAPDAYEEKLVWGVQSWLKAVTPGSPNKHSIPIFFFLILVWFPLECVVVIVNFIFLSKM